MVLKAGFAGTWGLQIAKCLLEIIDLGRDTSLQVLPHISILCMTPGFPAVETEP